MCFYIVIASIANKGLPFVQTSEVFEDFGCRALCRSTSEVSKNFGCFAVKLFAHLDLLSLRYLILHTP